MENELLLTKEERYEAGWGRDQNFDIDTLLEAQVTKVLKGRLDRPELMKQAKEIVLSIRQYLCNTEFAPEPFTEPVDLNKLTVVFPKKILALGPDIEEAKAEGYDEGYSKSMSLIEVAEQLAKKQERTRLMEEGLFTEKQFLNKFHRLLKSDEDKPMKIMAKIVRNEVEEAKREERERIERLVMAEFIDTNGTECVSVPKQALQEEK